MSLILSGTTGVSDVDGSAAAPAICGTDANTGIFFPAADTIAFSEGGAEAMRIESSGNVGIGTSSPQTRLDVSAPDSSNYDVTVSGGRSSNYSGSILFKNSYWSAGAYGAAAIRGLDSGSSGGLLAFYTTTNGGGTTGVPTERARIASNGQMSTTTGTGSVMAAYDARAWVNFNGTGTVAIRASGNVSSITDNGTGDYTINFTTAMPDANYSGQVCIGAVGASDGVGGGFSAATLIAASFRIRTLNASQSASKDFDAIYANVHR